MPETESASIVGADDPIAIEVELSRLGDALLRSADELIEAVRIRADRKRELAREARLDDAVEESFSRLGGLATIAVARWIAGDPVDDAFAAGQDFSRVFAQLAASSDVPLGEVVRRCQYWRDACRQEIFAAVAAGLASHRAAELARQSVDLAADHALASMSVIFDTERQQMQQELTRRQDELAFLATHDALTKLANRALVVERLERMLARHAQDAGADGGVAVLFIDLDGFKAINDTLGHRAGDRLLTATAARLRAAVRETDTLGRLGGDEFVVVSGASATDLVLADLATRLRGAFDEPFAIALDEDPLRITASVGVAVAEADCSAEQLLHRADLAMYSAKARRGVPVR
ncbi:MAG: diguanylate cyclase domain-containing protein [Solirubrobacteraceae bacterium]